MKSTLHPEVRHAIDALPDVLRRPVLLWFERLAEQRPDAPGQLAGIVRDQPSLLRLVASSEFAAGAMSREWPWFYEEVSTAGARQSQPVSDPGFGDDEANLANDADMQRRLRQFRNRSLLRILWREMSGASDIDDTLRSLADLADTLLRAGVAYAEKQVAARFGLPRSEAGEERRLVVLAMGKLGGRELNFSSDIDLVFLYSGDGESDGGRQLSAQEYFARLSRRVVALLDEVTPDGFVYRVDTRLRPFGDSGPPVVSFGALESYLLRHGRDWERYAYVKARVVDTGVPAGIVNDLTGGIIEPFVYRRYLDYGVFESLRDMKALVSAEAGKRQLAENLKLGPGGIREIEFIVQSMQLVRGGGDRRLRTPGLQPALRRLARRRSLRTAAAGRLTDAYRFLRRMENSIQALRDQQQHDIPVDEADRARVALAMGYPDWEVLSRALEEHRHGVERQFASVAFRGSEPASESDDGGPLAALWSTGAGPEDWHDALLTSGLPEPREVGEVLAEFRQGAAVQQIGQTGGRRLERFIPDLLRVLATREHPALTLRRVLSIVEQILRRSAYVALLNENPVVLQRLVGLCERSAWLTEEIGRYPLLLDELLDPRLYTASLSREEMQEELDRRFDNLAAPESEHQVEILGQFQRALLFRIAVADISGVLPIMKVSDRLTELAEIVLERTLSIAWADLTAKHGTPRASSTNGARDAGFGVIAYGKFGGMELSYRSDLDLVFLHDSAGARQETDGEKPLDNSMFFARLVRRIVHFLTARTTSGALYQVDTRLRPSGRSGLLVVSVEGFERYQDENAWTWEHQALLRSRPVAGSAAVCREFERIRGETLKTRVRRDRLRDDVCEMRARMRKELDRSPHDRFDLKQGAGGIGDIEFLVQYLVLANAENHRAVIHYSDNIRQLGVLAAAGCLGEAEAGRLQEIYKDYRLRLHHLALDERTPEVDEAEFTDERRFVTGQWNKILGGGEDLDGGVHA